MSKFKGLILPITIFAVSSIVGFVFVKNSPSLSSGTSLLINNEFLVTFITSIFGVSLTLFVFLYSVINNKEYNKKDDNIKQKIKELIIELKQDIYCIFIILSITLILILTNDIDIPFVSIDVSWVTRQEITTIIKLDLLIFTMIALFDITLSFFNLMKPED